MAGNHVEQLESRVRELEATLDGLTDELVDTKDRVETLEAAIDDGGASDRRSRDEIVGGELLADDERDAGDDIGEDADQETGNDRATSAESGETNGTPEVAGTDEEKEEFEDTDGIIVA
jgi:cobalamin biosynthesis protein CobT